MDPSLSRRRLGVILPDFDVSYVYFKHAANFKPRQILGMIYFKAGSFEAP